MSLLRQSLPSPPATFPSSLLVVLVLSLATYGHVTQAATDSSLVTFEGGGNADEKSEKPKERVSSALAEQAVARELSTLSSSTRNFKDVLAKLLEKIAIIEEQLKRREFPDGKSVRSALENQLIRTIDDNVPESERQKWKDVAEGLVKRLVAKVDGQTNHEDWAIGLASAHRAIESSLKTSKDAAKVQIPEDFWYAESDDENKPNTYAGYWDPTFDVNAKKLAAIFEDLAQRSDITDADAMRAQFKLKVNAFLDEIEKNNLFPEKRTTWANLIEAWRGKLLEAKRAGTFDAANIDQYRQLYRDAAMGLKKAASDWDDARKLGAAQGASTGVAKRGGSENGISSRGGSSSSKTLAAVWHERAMSQIDRTHDRHMNRIERVKTRRPAAK